MTNRIDYDALNQLERQYGPNLDGVKENNPLLKHIRKSLNATEKQAKAFELTPEDEAELRYYWNHGVRSYREFKKLMPHSQTWFQLRLEHMGLIVPRIYRKH